MIYLSQYDPRWCQKLIGASTLTLGRQGCAITSVCNALAKFGIYFNPDELASHVELFTPQGLIIWAKVQEWLKAKYPYKSFSIYRYYGRSDQAIVQNLKPGSAVLLQVANKSHWVMAERKQWLRNDYTVGDSWGGVARTAIGDYSNITGYVIIRIT
jgi:hypothetical protein